MIQQTWAVMKETLIRACRNSRALKFCPDSKIVEIVDSGWYIEMSEVLRKLTSKLEADRGRGNVLTEKWFKEWKKSFNEMLEDLPEVESVTGVGKGTRRRKRNASGNSNQSNSKRIRMDGSRSRNPSGASSTAGGSSGLYIKNESQSDDDQEVLNRPPRPKRASRAKRPIVDNEDDSQGSEIKKNHKIMVIITVIFKFKPVLLEF